MLIPNPSTSCWRLLTAAAAMIALSDKSTTSLPSLPSFLTSNSSSRRILRPLTAALGLLLLASWLGLFSSAPSYTSHIHTSRFPSNASDSHTIPQSDASTEFWDLFAYAMAKGEPNFPEVKRANGKDEPWMLYNPDAEEPRVNNLELSSAQVENLRVAHRAIMKDAHILAPKLPFVAGTRGIVTSCANDAITILTTSLRMLRQSGSTLPVEIVIDYYEAVPCEEIFPALGARCVLLKDHMPKQMSHPLEVKHFLNKVLSVLFSSFEHALYIDSDMFPVTNPDSIFVTEPFISKGFVLWPDYWANTVSHYYYEIVGREVPKTSERSATESGALLVNKNTHAEALILTAYYNAWGPKYWYRLFSQNAPGEGDKETWLAAIEALKLPFYQVSERPGHIGYRCDGKKRSIASAQHHPLDDWLITSNGIERHRKETYLADAAEPRPLFVHGNLPKYDSVALLSWSIEDIDWTDVQRCKDGKPHRLWGPKELSVAKFGWDVEKAVWDSMRWTSCEHEYDFAMWVNGTWHSAPAKNVCKNIVAFYEELFPGEPYRLELPQAPRQERPWGGAPLVS